MTICEFTLGYVDCYKELLATTPLAMHKELHDKCKKCSAIRCKINRMGFKILLDNDDNDETKILKSLGLK